MRRKKYSRPVVESEIVFEKTSLACTATEPWPELVHKVEMNPVPILFAYSCLEDVSKGGNLDDGCGTAALDLPDSCVVVFS